MIRRPGMYIAYDKEGKVHKFHHAIDWKTVIRDKGFTENPPGAPAPEKPVAVKGEKIEGIEVAKTPEKEATSIADLKEEDPNIIIGERIGKVKKAKIER